MDLHIQDADWGKGMALHILQMHRRSDEKDISWRKTSINSSSAYRCCCLHARELVISNPPFPMIGV